MKTKPDEIAMMKEALNNTNAVPFERCFRNVPEGMNIKRFLFILYKWVGRGWFDYGVSLRTGWLTPEGVAALSAFLSHQSS